MKPSILSIGYPFAPVSDSTSGGAEQVLASLDRALVGQGYRSLVIAPAGSIVRGELLALASIPSTFDEEAKRRVHDELRQTVANVLAREPVDLIHLHGVDFFEYLPSPGVPALVTLHLPLAWYPDPIWRLARPRTYLHCVSETQHASAPAGNQLLPPISNGVDVTRFRPRAQTENYAMFLGRICPEKGLDIALRAARASRIPLLAGGRVYPYEAHQRYFREQVEPLLDGCRRFLGELPLNRKARLLSAARCLLIPSLAEETSSLVAMEALASGTPVIAFRRGALPGIVDHGKTGFLVDNEAQMTEAIGYVERIDRSACRRSAEARFSDRYSIAQYLDLYRTLTKSYQSTPATAGCVEIH